MNRNKFFKMKEILRNAILVSLDYTFYFIFIITLLTCQYILNIGYGVVTLSLACLVANIGRRFKKEKAYRDEIKNLEYEMKNQAERML